VEEEFVDWLCQLTVTLRSSYSQLSVSQTCYTYLLRNFWLVVFVLLLTVLFFYNISFYCVESVHGVHFNYFVATLLLDMNLLDTV